MSKSKAVKQVVDYRRIRAVERDLACLQVELAAMGERVDMVEGENKALRAMLLSRSVDEPYWRTHTGHFVQPVSMTVSEGGEWR